MTRWDSVEVIAPSRLHFGLLSFGRTSGRLFGGVGVMLDSPAVRLLLKPAGSFAVIGPHADRVREFAARWLQSRGEALVMSGGVVVTDDLDRFPCAIEVLQAARQHVGLGVGTQLGLSVAAGLNTCFELPLSSVAELAASVGRGERSGVGAYGFALGGLIFECGRSSPASFPELHRRLPVPPEWRFVLACPRQRQGLSGPQERAAFSQLPPVAAEVSEQLFREAEESMVPALAQGCWEAFSASVYRYGCRAGLCFQPIQGSAFNGPLVESMVRRLRSWGVSGVGQTSWGPTVFAVLPNEPAARELQLRLERETDAVAWEVCVTGVNNVGARIVGTVGDQSCPLHPVVAAPGMPS